VMCTPSRPLERVESKFEVKGDVQVTTQVS
jgi:hypothetical protein